MERVRRPPRASRTDAADYAERRGGEARRKKQKQRWFKRGQRWRTGCEGRISDLKRRHGLNRCRYRGPSGIERWVGLGVIADNLISMGRVLTMRGAEA
jgi:IS5 family transposase